MGSLSQQHSVRDVLSVRHETMKTLERFRKLEAGLSELLHRSTERCREAREALDNPLCVRPLRTPTR